MVPANGLFMKCICAFMYKEAKKITQLKIALFDFRSKNGFTFLSFDPL
jgi:hypothetical protein